MDFDANDVFTARPQGASAGEDVRNERVFRMADLFAVHKHVGDAVQPLKAEARRARGKGFGHEDGFLKRPVPVFIGLIKVFVCAVIRVGLDSGAEKIQLHVAGHLRCEGKRFALRRASAKRPFAVQRKIHE